MSVEDMKGQDSDKQQLLSEEDNDDGLGHHVSQTRRRRSCATLTTLLLCSTVLLAVTSVGLAVALYKTSQAKIFSHRHPSPVPPMPRTTITFEEHSLFAGPSTLENDRAWAAMMPRGDGFIKLSNPASFNLPPGKSGRNGEQIYDISLFHQLHCLTGIRTHLLLLQGSIGRNNSQEIQSVLLDPQWPHVFHCFDYIRQALMCGGDMAVEWPRTEADGRRFAFDGWGVGHECASWDAIMAFMEENDVTNDE